MKSLIDEASDARQTRAWGDFLKNIGWSIAKIDELFVFYRPLPLTGRTVIKIQHPQVVLPLQKIETFARKHKALFVIIEPHITGYDKQALVSHGFSISKLRFTHSATRLIDLRLSEKALLASFSENIRRNLKKSQRLCRYEIIPLDTGDISSPTERFYDLYKKLGQMKNFYVPSFHEVNGKVQAFRKTSVMLFAYDSNEQSTEPIAVLWIGGVKQTLIYFHPGNTTRGYELYANVGLIWEAIKWGRKQGYNVLDFETAYDARYPHENKQWKGYSDFKKKFGGEMIEYPPSYIKFYNPLAKYIYLLGTLLSK